MRSGYAWALSILSLACQPKPESSPERARAQPTAAPVARIRFYPASHLVDLADSIQQKIERVQARGIGTVVPDHIKDPPSELVVSNDTAGEVQTAARVRFYAQPDGGWSDTTWAREPNLHGQLIRATHEDYGLPVLSRHADWLRVAYAFTKLGEPKLGWVKLSPPRTQFHESDKQMLEFSNSLTDPMSTTFYRAPNGQPVKLPLAPSHFIEVLRINGNWIQINVVRPDTSSCTGTIGAKVQHSDTVWIARYNSEGLRQISTAVAGC